MQLAKEGEADVSNNDVFVFRYDKCNSSEPISEPDLAARGLSVEVWRPSIRSFRPKGLGWYPWAIWSLFDRLRISRSGIYRILVVYADDTVEPVFRAAMLPRSWKTPFMEQNSVQISSVGVASNRRRQGIGSIGIRLLIDETPKGTDSIYYICRRNNLASIKLAESCGFKYYAQGRRWKFGPLSHYFIQKEDH